MTGPDKQLITAVATYFADLRRVRGTGGGTDERSYYPEIRNLLNSIGCTLKPKVFCVHEGKDQGVGHPDFALYTASQVQKGRPRKGQFPERGVVEVKPVADDAWVTAESDQVSRYWGRYRLVLVTNLRNFVLVGAGGTGDPAKLETFRLAEDADDFWRKVERPRAFAREVGAGLGEYLARALSHRAALAEPRDLAWLLASYARDGLARVEAVGDTPSLMTVRKALEEALGIRFEGKRGDRFFRSTLIQTLFYGVFSAWVLWSREEQKKNGPLFEGHYSPERFRWREASWHLRAPVLRALFRQLSDPGGLHSLGLVEVMDWTSAALDRVDRTTFFSRFDEGEAVQYFYEPFLEAFDPVLRKQLGVWYTPTELVRYMVARVDKALKNDLGIVAGLAAENVYVLDPCCGTGAYMAEVLRRIARNLGEQGLGALAGEAVRKAAIERVFGFEIMPAPFVVAHLQVGLTMENLDAPLAEDGSERANVFLTNALTGWEPHANRPLPFPELEDERDRAEHVKQDTPILVILGNPPYDGFAGVAVGDEERALSEAYRTTKRVREPKGKGLNDPYVRFYRMAERRIAEKTGKGVVCFISNYSWLDGQSFTGMRERYLEAFDTIRIDNLHGDRIISEYAPDGRSSETVFAVAGKSPGIKVGTSITLLSKAGTGNEPLPSAQVRYRDFHQARAAERRRALLVSLDADSIDAGYSTIEPSLRLGLPFKPTLVSADWFDWPALSDLFPESFPGVKTSRDAFLVDTDLDRLRGRVADYFDPALSHEAIARRYPSVIKSAALRAVRDHYLRRGGPDESGFIRLAYRPFDNRWLYWDPDGLLDRPRADYKPHVFEGNPWMVLQNKARPDLSPPLLTPRFGDLNQMNSGVYCVPAFLCATGFEAGDAERQYRPNLSSTARTYLRAIDADVLDLFHHCAAVLHGPIYNRLNADALRAEGPRIPLPGWPNGGAAGAAEELARSAAHGRDLAALLDSATSVPGVTGAPLRSEIAAIAVPTTVGGRNMTDDDFAVTAGWGYFERPTVVKSGKGRVVERDYMPGESAAMEHALPWLGDVTVDVHLNGEAYWRNVPAAVWDYRLGGYPVLKKWLSYREHKVLGRRLQAEEVQHFADTARRIAALLINGSNSVH